MTEKELKSLGFKKEKVSAEEAGSPKGYYYYSLKIGDIELITNENDTVKDEEDWAIHFLESNTFETKYFAVAEDLVEILKTYSHDNRS